MRRFAAPQAAAVSGGRLLATFTLQLDASENVAAFPIIYTMGPVSNGVLQPHDVSIRSCVLARPCCWIGSSLRCRLQNPSAARIRRLSQYDGLTQIMV